MAGNISETPTWETTVPSIDNQDDVQGSPTGTGAPDSGINNIPHVKINHRLNYLKGNQDPLITDVAAIQADYMKTGGNNVLTAPGVPTTKAASSSIKLNENTYNGQISNLVHLNAEVLTGNATLPVNCTWGNYDLMIIKQDGSAAYKCIFSAHITEPSTKYYPTILTDIEPFKLSVGAAAINLYFWVSGATVRAWNGSGVPLRIVGVHTGTDVGV